MPLLFENATAARIEALPRLQTVFFFPVGPLEDHGPHLPLGLDTLEAEKLSWMAAERLERDMPGWVGVVLPRAPLGIDSDTAALALTVRAHVLRDWLVDAAMSLHRKGFAQFVCFSGHLGPRQLTAIEEAGRMLRRRTRGGILRRIARGFPRGAILVSASSGLATREEAFRAPFRADPAEHGGAADTSVALAIDSDWVEPSFLELPKRTLDKSAWKRGWEHRRRRTQGYWGEPAKATRDGGDKLLREKIDDLFPKIRAVLEGSEPTVVFRSWYSAFPPNKSFFHAWLIGMAALAILLAWFYVTFQAMTAV